MVCFSADLVITQVETLAHSWRIEESDARHEQEEQHAEKCRQSAMVLERLARDLREQRAALEEMRVGINRPAV